MYRAIRKFRTGELRRVAAPLETSQYDLAYMTKETAQKLLKKRARLDQKKNFFPVTIVGKWNYLGPTRKRGRSCNHWQLQEEIGESSTLSSDQLERTSDKLYK